MLLFWTLYLSKNHEKCITVSTYNNAQHHFWKVTEDWVLAVDNSALPSQEYITFENIFK